MIVNLPDNVKNFVTRLGLEPKMTGPKPVVLPITPSGSIEVPVRFELTNNGFAIHPLKPLGYRTLSTVGGTFPVGPALTYSTFG